MRDHSSRLAANLFWGDMFCEDLLVVFRCLLFFVVGRSKEIQDERHGVMDPLTSVLREERTVVVARAESDWLAWDYDVTRGYPGEDKQNLLS